MNIRNRKFTFWTDTNGDIFAHEAVTQKFGWAKVPRDRELSAEEFAALVAEAVVMLEQSRGR